jgi:hypothetical protein
LHAISADDLIRFSQDIKYDEIRNRESKYIDNMIKPDAMMDLVKNLKRELNYERERNFEVEQKFRDLQRELSRSHTE